MTLKINITKWTGVQVYAHYRRWLSFFLFIVCVQYIDCLDKYVPRLTPCLSSFFINILFTLLTSFPSKKRNYSLAGSFKSSNGSYSSKQSTQYIPLLEFCLFGNWRNFVKPQMDPLILFHWEPPRIVYFLPLFEHQQGDDASLLKMEDCVGAV